MIDNKRKNPVKQNFSKRKKIKTVDVEPVSHLLCGYGARKDAEFVAHF